MNITRGAASLFGLAMLLWTASIAIAQSEPEVRRARPIDEPPVRRAVPADESIDKVLRSLKEDVSEPSPKETEGADQRQLDYANGLFARKLYDLAIPEYAVVVRDGIEQLKQAGIDVLLMDLQFAPKILAHPHVAEMQRALASIAAEENVPVFHRLAAMEHWISSGQLTFRKMLSKDGLHMNDLSYGCVGRLLADSIAERVRTPAVVSRR